MKEIKDLIDNEIVNILCDIEFGLNDWEINFVEDVSSFVRCGCKLTEKQKIKAIEIIEEKGKNKND